MKRIHQLTVSLLALLGGAGLTGCTSQKAESSLRSKLETPTGLEFEWDDGTFSFTGVANATYYRVYFYNVGEPDDTIGNTDYFKSHTEEKTETYPDGNTSTSTVTVYDTDDNGNYVLKDQEEILAMSPTFSKRYSASYTDANGDKVSYKAGEKVTFTLPNDSVGGGTYYIGVKAGGPISLYSMSDFLLAEGKVNAIMHYIDPEMSLSYSNTFDGYEGVETTSTNPFGGSSTSTTKGTNQVLDGTGMMFEISNADSFYSANPNASFTYTITDSTGAEVSFKYANIKMNRNDSNTFCGWTVVEQPETAGTSGTASVSHYIFGHSGPTMEYQTSGFFYINGLTEGENYTLHIKAVGDDGKTSYDSNIVDYEFTAEVTEWTVTGGGDQGGGGGGFPGGGDQGGGFPGGNEGGDQGGGPTDGGDTTNP